MSTGKLLIAAATLLVAGCYQAPSAGFEFAEGQVQHAVRSAEMEWKPCPPHLPTGCEVVVLEGNPQGDGMFTVRFRVNADFMMPPHTHPKDERVTVFSGKVSVGFGADALHDDASRFGPGDYYVNAPNAVHTVWIDEPSEIQVTGIGPWEVHFVD